MIAMKDAYAVIFDKTLEWTIAVTHEDISILVGVEINTLMKEGE